MKYYLDEKEVTLEELAEVYKNLLKGEYIVETLEVCKIESKVIYFTVKANWK